MARHASGWLRLMVLLLALAAGGAMTRADEAAAPAVRPLELVANGGFEETDSGGLPVAWRAEWGGTVGVTVSLVKAREARSGAHALRFLTATASPLACFNRPLDVSGVAGREVTVSCFYRTRGKPQADIGVVIYAEPFAAKETATPYLTSERWPLAEAEDWRLASWRLRCPAAAREALLVLRSAGVGQVTIDDVSVRPAPLAVGMDLLRSGELVSLPARREVRVRVRNDTDAARTLRLTAAAYGGRKPASRAETVKVTAHGRVEVPFAYDCPADQSHRLELALEDPAALSMCDTCVVRIPPLLTARITEPAFRGVIVASIPSKEIVVEGRINADEALARDLALEADLGGAGRVARDGSGITRPDGPQAFRLALACSGLLRGRYPLTITASRGGKAVGSVVVPVARAQEAPHETACDSRGRFCVDGKPVFVNGIYNVADEGDLPRIADRGFNLVVVPSGTAGLDFVRTAEKLGLMVVIYSPNTPLTGEGPQPSFWTHAVDKYSRSAAVVGWHLLSRPDASLVPPALFAAQQAAVADLDVHHPIVTLLSAPSLLPEFAPYCDVLAFGSQPVPTLPLDTVAEELAAARQAALPGRPVWAAIQSVGRAWLNVGGGTHPETGGRIPTGAEHRAMTFLALTHGAQGLLHHGFTAPGARAREAFYLPKSAPELWESMKQTNAMVARISEAILSGAYRGVEITGPMHVGAWDYQGRVYVAAVNAQAHPALTTFVLPGKSPEALCPIGDPTPIPRTKAGRFADELPAYGAKVYVGEAGAQ